jgi:hypothetical protein
MNVPIIFLYCSCAVSAQNAGPLQLQRLHIAQAGLTPKANGDG